MARPRTLLFVLVAASLPACNVILGISGGEPAGPAGSGGAGTSSTDTSSSAMTGGGGTTGSSTSSSTGLGGAVPCAGGGPKGDKTLFAKRTGGGNGERGTAVAVTITGEVAWAGTYTGPDTAFGLNALPYPMPANGDEGTDVFVARYDEAGLHQWSVGYGGVLDQAPLALVADPNGNMVLTGSMQGSIDFGGEVLNAVALDGFVAKLFRDDGGVLWAKPITGPGNEIGEAVAIDGDGDVVVAGVTTDTVDLGCGPLDQPMGPGVFLAKLDQTDGHCLWSHKYGADTRFYDQDSLGYRVTLASDAVTDDIYLAGGAAGPNFGQGATTAFGDKDVFVFKATGNGEFVAARTFGSPNDDGTQYATGIALDGCGHVILAGGFNHSLEFGASVLTTAKNMGAGADDDDVFVAVLDTQLSPIWAKSFGDAGFQSAVGVGVDGASNILVAARAIDVPESTGVDFGGGPLLGLGDYTQQPGSYGDDILAAKLDPSGNHVWSKRWGTRSYDDPRALSVALSGKLAIAGDFTTDSTPSVLDFGGASQPLSSAYQDGFLVVVGP